MSEISTIKFVDLDSGEQAFALVRVAGGAAGLALSILSNGDIEVFLGAKELDELIDALTRARGLLGTDE